MHSDETSPSQIGEFPAIILLNNAELEERTLTNITLQLIRFAQASRGSYKGPNMHEVSFASIKEMRDGMKYIAQIFKDRSVPKRKLVFINYFNRICTGVSSALNEIGTVLDGISKAPRPEKDYLVHRTRPESRLCPIMTTP